MAPRLAALGEAERLAQDVGALLREARVANRAPHAVVPRLEAARPGVAVHQPHVLRRCARAEILVCAPGPRLVLRALGSCVSSGTHNALDALDTSDATLPRAALGSTSARGSRRAGISLPSPGPLRARGSVDAIRSSQAVHPRRAGRTPGSDDLVTGARDLVRVLLVDLQNLVLDGGLLLIYKILQLLHLRVQDILHLPRLLEHMHKPLHPLL
mmetsp:Transcript_45444/g.107783  ORF Transcript_45444/g.107783 Transcript_45444/m.107783 type:complete len:213 (+) Transcript_45444:2664-3302(+)